MALLVAFWASWASAQTAMRVLVLEPEEPSERERELSTRLKGELAAAGFDVLSEALSREADPRIAVAVQGSQRDPVAAFAIGSADSESSSSEQSAPALELWLSDRIEGAIIRQSGDDGRGGPKAISLLAVQGVELLQARVAALRLQIELEPAEVEEPPPPPPVAPPPPSAGIGIGIGAGVGIFLEGASGGSAPTPVLRGSWSGEVDIGERAAIGLGARLSAAGFGRAIEIRAPARQVDVHQSLALAEGLLVLAPQSWLQPFVSLGAGAYRVEVEGFGEEQAVGRLRDTWSALAAVGAGLSLSAAAPWFLEVEGQGLFALHPTSVRISGNDAAMFGRPLFLFSAALGVKL